MNGWVRRLVTIEQPTGSSVDEASGTEVTTWEPLVALPGSPVVAEQFWAWFRDVRPGKEQSTNGLVLAKNAAELRLRWRDDVTAVMRVIVHGDSDATYAIIGGPAEVSGRKREIELLLERASS